MIRYYLTLISLYIFSISVLEAHAGTTGRIRGQISDDEGSPISGAVIKLQSSPYQSRTQNDGSFFLIGIESGTYTVAVYREDQLILTVANVQVLPDQTTELKLSRETCSSSLDNHSQAFIANVTLDSFRYLPSKKIEEILKFSSAGVYESHGSLNVKGGGAGELGFFMNHQWTPVSLPYQAIDRILFYSSPLDVSYGHSNSGVVDILPKHGSDQFSIEADIFTDQAARLLLTPSYRNTTYSLSAGGPIGTTINFFAAAELNTADDIRPGYWGHPKVDVLADTVIFGSGYKKGARPDNVNRNDAIKLYGNLDWKLSSSFQAGFETAYHSQNENRFSSPYLFTPDRVPHREATAAFFSLYGKYFLSNNLFIQSRGNYFNSDEQAANDDIFKTVQKNLTVLSTTPVVGSTGSSTFYNDNLFYDINGGPSFYTKDEMNNILLSLSMGWQINAYNFIEGGIETQRFTIRHLEPIQDDPDFGNNYGYKFETSNGVVKPKAAGTSGLDGAKNPSFTSLFIQDHFTYSLNADLRLDVKAGLRYDRFDAGTKTLANIFDPTGQTDPDQNGKYDDVNHDGIYNSGDRYWAGTMGPEDFKNKKVLARLSPHISGTLAISDIILLFGQASLTQQFHDFRYYYVNTEWLERMSIAPYGEYVLGNSDLKPASHFFVETGFKATPVEMISGGLLLYYRHTSDFIEKALVVSQPSSLITYYNFSDRVAFGSVLFGALTFPSAALGLQIAYTDITEEGSFENSGFRASWLGYSETKFDATASHERPLNVVGSMHIHPVTTGFFSGFNCYAVARYTSGLPYTPYTIIPIQVNSVPQGRVTGRRNSKRTEGLLSADLKLSKHFKLSQRYALTAYIQVNNVLNNKNPRQVFLATGEPDDDGFLSTPAGQSLSARALNQYTVGLKENDYMESPRQAFMGIEIQF